MTPAYGKLIVRAILHKAWVVSCGSSEPATKIFKGAIHHPRSTPHGRSGYSGVAHAREYGRGTVLKIDGVAAGRIAARARQHHGEPRRLGGRQRRRRHAEMIVGGGLRPVHPVAPLD